MRRFSHQHVLAIGATLLTATSSAMETNPSSAVLSHARRGYKRPSYADNLRRKRATRETSAFYGNNTTAAGYGFAISPRGEVATPDIVEGFALPPLRRDEVPTDGSSAAYPPLRGDDMGGGGFRTGPNEKVFLNHRGGTDAKNYTAYGADPISRVVGPAVDSGGEFFGNTHLRPSTLAQTLTDDKNLRGEGKGALFDSYSAAALAETLPEGFLDNRSNHFGDRADVATILRYQQYIDQQKFGVKEAVDAKHNWATPAAYYKARALRAEVASDRIASGSGQDASEVIAERCNTPV